ncbi:MAG TPA: class II aldolase/adducin family protein [Afifellaceae bacterium]|nr:class II aldolase/adducin family protein [Afifellaceae bacterium]
MPPEDGALRQEIVATALAMSRRGLSPQRSGNVSARRGDSLLITPSATPYEAMQPADIVAAGLDGSLAAGQRRPSTETPFHRAIYAARPDAQAIVHCHSPKATALACARLPIPAFHYMVAVAGGADIRCADYATFGTEALAANSVAALTGRRACLLANHGQVAIAASLEAALELAAEVETLAGTYLDLLASGQKVHILDEEEMARVLEAFEDYGRDDPWGAMWGSVTVQPGSDLTQPTGEVWNAESGNS